MERRDAERAILELLARRDPGKTICPSDAARALGGDDGFRPLMPLVRDAARELVDRGEIEVTQGGTQWTWTPRAGRSGCAGGPRANSYRVGRLYVR